MKTVKIVIYEKNKEDFEKIKKVCNELELQSFPSSFEGYETFKADLKSFIGETGEFKLLYLISLNPIEEKSRGVTFYLNYAKDHKTIFIVGKTTSKKSYLQELSNLCKGAAGSFYIEKDHKILFTDYLLFRIRNWLKPKKGEFILNNKRARIPTSESMYDCVDCLKQNIAHQIVRIPGPPAEATTQSAMKGEATTLRECTSCGAQDGPWVIAQV
jgi:hypothetical protein